MLIQAFVAGSFVSSLGTIVRYSKNLQTYYRRYAAPGFEPNDMALTLALVIPLAMYLAMDGRPVFRWLYRAAAGLAISALLLTASRTGLVVCVVAFGFAVWTWRASSLEQKLANVALLAILISGTVRFAPPTARARLATLPAEASSGTLHQRTQIWQAGLKMVKDHPLLGVGVGSYAEGVRPYLASVGLPNYHFVAHNTFLSVLAECGLIGFTLYAMWLLVQATYIWALPFAERALWSVTLAVWAMGGMTLSWEHRKPGWLFLGLVMTAWARSFGRSGARQ
jgi:O-antigen ligase